MNEMLEALYSEEDMNAVRRIAWEDLDSFIQFVAKNRELSLNTVFTNPECTQSFSLMGQCIRFNEYEKVALLLDSGCILDEQTIPAMRRMFLNVPRSRGGDKISCLPNELLDRFIQLGHDFEDYLTQLNDYYFRDILRTFWCSDSVENVFNYLSKILNLDEAVDRCANICVYSSIIYFLYELEKIENINEFYGDDYIPGQRTNEIINVFVQRGYPARQQRDWNLVEMVVRYGNTSILANCIQKGLINTSKREGVLRSLMFRCDDELNLELYEMLIPSVGFDESGVVAKAIDAGNTTFAEYLIIKGVDPDAEVDGKPLIQHAFERDNKRIAAQLVDRIENYNFEPNKGATVVDVFSATAGFKKLANKLIMRGAKSASELFSESGSVNFVELAEGLMVVNGEPWLQPFLEGITNADVKSQEALYQIVKLCSSNKSAQPSKKFLIEFSQWVDIIGNNQFQTLMSLILPRLLEPAEVGDIDTKDYPDSFTYQFIYGYDDEEAKKGYIRYSFTHKNTQIIKGLIWGCIGIHDPSFARDVRLVAKSMYSKIPGIGPRNATLGNAATIALCDMPFDSGLKEVAILKSSFKYPRAIKSIEAVLSKAAKKRGISIQELEDKMVSDYGMTEVGVLEYQFDDNFVGRFEVLNGTKTQVEYKSSETGKVTKSVPVALSKIHQQAVKDFKDTIKDIQKALSAQSSRLEGFYLSDQTFSMVEFSEKFVYQNLVGVLVRRLIWCFSHKGSVVSAFYLNGEWVDQNGGQVTIDQSSKVTLWHPISSEADDVLAWREFMFEQKVTQPFKQAFREVYALTGAEIETHDHSQRFANHIIKHDVFHALAEQRSWAQTKGGTWDGGSENEATKYLKAHGILVYFEAIGLDQYDTNDYGMYAACGTGHVSFNKDGRRIPLSDIKPIVFSECMRDVDLFVGVCSVALDDSWRETAGQYWSGYGFGELNQSAKARYDVIKRILPMIKNGSKMELIDKFLVVHGIHRTYKIHLGSSNILMEPNDMYLCIVPKTESGVLLPFEGDRTLGLILSKAIMLSNDSKIKDETIRSQIGI